MKRSDFPPAPSGQRVRVFMAEKGLDVPIVELNVCVGEQHQEPFASMKPSDCDPLLELDDGTVVAESVSICR